MGWVLLLLGARWVAADWDHAKDSRALAGVIAESARGIEYDEIVFVDSWPRFDLAMYLDVTVEPVFSDEAHRLPYRGETSLLSELVEHEKRIFVADDENIGHLEASLDQDGLKLLEIGRWKNLVLFTLGPEG